MCIRYCNLVAQVVVHWSKLRVTAVFTTQQSFSIPMQGCKSTLVTFRTVLQTLSCILLFSQSVLSWTKNFLGKICMEPVMSVWNFRSLVNQCITPKCHTGENIPTTCKCYTIYLNLLSLSWCHSELSVLSYIIQMCDQFWTLNSAKYDIKM